MPLEPTSKLDTVARFFTMLGAIPSDVFACLMIASGVALYLKNHSDVGQSLIASGLVLFKGHS